MSDTEMSCRVVPTCVEHVGLLAAMLNIDARAMVLTLTGADEHGLLG